MEGDRRRASEADTLVSDGDEDTVLSGGSSRPVESVKELPRGAELGRYVVLAKLGAGGMGVVYAAYDPKLDRRVAVKLLDMVKLPGTEGDPGEVRFFREAQAMARLSHPNVVTVHDVDTYDGHVFLAMEFIDGGTLKDWLADTKRSWREILYVFLQAGRGLAAAHDAGIIHRDFKPDNVMVKDEDTVRVADFGLARGIEQATREEKPDLTSASSSALSQGLTATGSLMGTPAYMSPEQFGGGAIDARTDQFSFCVALYYALYNERPFAGQSLVELSDAVQSGAIRDVPKRPEVPAWLAKLVRRGLSTEPGDRFPSMHALLRELSRDPGAARKRFAWIAGPTVVAIGATAAVTQVASNDVDLCGGARDQLIGVWDDAQRSAVHDALAATGRSYAEDVWRSVSLALDDYADSWVAMRTDACRATHVTGEQSPTVLDQRMVCLERRRRPLAVLTELLAEADPKLLDKALQAVDGLPGLADCADVESLSRGLRPPDDPGVREQVEELRQELAATKALESAGRYQEALAHVEPVVERALALPYVPLHAEALTQIATLHDDLAQDELAEDALHRAIGAAVESGHHEVFVRSLVRLVWLLRSEPSREQEVDRFYALGLSGIAAMGGNHTLETALKTNYGNALRIRADYQESLAILEEVLALRLEHDAPEGTRVAGAYVNLGSVQFNLDDIKSAEQSLRHALKIFTARKGTDHPDTVQVLGNLALMIRQRDDYETSIKMMLEVLNKRELNFGPDHPNVAGTLLNLGGTLADSNQPGKAVAYLQRCLVINERRHGADHVEVAQPLGNLAWAYVYMGEHELALETVNRAQAIFENNYDRFHPSLIIGLNIRARALRKLGRVREARAALTDALERSEHKLGTHHHQSLSLIVELAEVELLAKRPATIENQLEQALEHAKKADQSPKTLADVSFALARVLWSKGDDRKRSIELAERALEVYATVESLEQERAIAERWLADHRGS